MKILIAHSVQELFLALSVQPGYNWGKMERENKSKGDARMLRAVEVRRSEESALFNLLQKYLYEMSTYYDNVMDESGNFPYKYLPYYFKAEAREQGRQAFFFYDDLQRIGFALINTHSFTGEQVDNCIAEFTIFPAYRRQGNGMQALEALRTARHGSWQLKYSNVNRSGAAFWQKVKQNYHGTEQKLNETETAITFD
ncbi:MAG: hypothetical protein LUD79_05330 [Oscillospiraceae bacterium]|nr:hypothetical protein [Oscillospiraceae bacterium]